MQREIGSNFWILPQDLKADAAPFELEAPGCRGTDSVWLSTGRSAISFALEEARRRNPELGRTALVPPFTCHTVVQPFLDAGYTVRSYPVDRALCTDGNALLHDAEEAGASVVLVHRYFGFDTLPGCGEALEELRKRDVVTIEDRTQCLYSGFGALPADFLIGSIRKWAGMPDGGFAVCREGVFPEKPSEPDAALEAAKIAAGTAKYLYLFENTGEKDAFLKLYREAEDILDRQNRYYAAAGLSLRMQAALDRDALRQKRRENYRTLLEGLKDCPGVRPLFSALPETAVPLYFPLWVEGDRAALQAHLRDASIYAPVVWPRPDWLPPVCEEAEAFYEHLLCLPVDQRYGRDDMARTVEQVRLAERKYL